VQLQTSGYYPNLKLVELITLFNGLYNRDVDPMSLLEMVNLKDKANAKVKELSGGQKQRFSVATTLINDPKIVFLDEPTTGLDPQARRNLWDLVRSIRDKGTTVIITTHYMDEAEVLCDRVAIIDAGKIIALDSPDGLIDSLVSSGFEDKGGEEANLKMCLSVDWTFAERGEIKCKNPMGKNPIKKLIMRKVIETNKLSNWQYQPNHLLLIRK
jgi:ABC-2 type transport system ATP-binding protein